MKTTTTTATRAEWLSIGDIIRAYNPGEGRHYFDPASLRWFRSRLPEGGWQLPSGVILFAESTKNDGPGYSNPRRYSVVALVPSPSRRKRGLRVEKPHGFEAFATRSAANAAVERLIKSNDPAPYFDGNLKYAAECARAAASAWEESNDPASGVSPSTIEAYCRCADQWAGLGGCRLEWASFRPGLIIPRSRRAIPFGEWTARVAELHPERA